MKQNCFNFVGFAQLTLQLAEFKQIEIIYEKSLCQSALLYVQSGYLGDPTDIVIELCEYLCAHCVRLIVAPNSIETFAHNANQRIIYRSYQRATWKEIVSKEFSICVCWAQWRTHLNRQKMPIRSLDLHKWSFFAWFYSRFSYKNTAAMWLCWSLAVNRQYHGSNRSIRCP